MKQHENESVAVSAKHAQRQLLDHRTANGHWIGQLSASALSTATAISAFSFFLSQTPSARSELDRGEIEKQVGAGIAWLMDQQNTDGGWGDTPLNDSNISTTMLAVAALHAAGRAAEFAQPIANAQGYIDAQGGIAGLKKRYGRDRTFAVPILANCAMAGLVPWKEVSALPFEAAVVPQRFYQWLQLPVVSYAIPALVAIGQAKFHFDPPWDPVRRTMRKLSIGPGLRVLEQIQPASGGYLEAIPLTSFVTMSLIRCGRADHPVVQNGLTFLLDSFREESAAESCLANLTSVRTSAKAAGASCPLSPENSDPSAKQDGDAATEFLGERAGDEALANVDADARQLDEGEGATSACGLGSWPIDTNLATWVTSLSINALANEPSSFKILLEADTEVWQACLSWLLSCQNTAKHPFTGAAPGGWGWSDLSGAVPDADDTPGAMLALRAIVDANPGWLSDHQRADITGAAMAGAEWLLGLQNRDGGWPTFCRGWGKLPFDRSGSDLTAHAIRGLLVWQRTCPLQRREQIDRAVNAGFRYLKKQQCPNGSWLPLWFGNQDQPDDANPFYGTAKVLLAYRDGDRNETSPAVAGYQWLVDHQNADGGWGGGRVDAVQPERWNVARLGTSSVEETALCTEALLGCDIDNAKRAALAGVRWLAAAVESNAAEVASPIGFYFAKLWYFEKLYPMIFTTAALQRALHVSASRWDNKRASDSAAE